MVDCGEGLADLDPVAPPEAPPTDLKQMQGNITPKLIERLECKRLLERLSFSIEAAQAIVHNHGYNMAEKLSQLKPNDVDVLVKTLYSPGGERNDRTKYHGISILHSA